MPQKEFIIRGKTSAGRTEVLNFGGIAKGYAYRLTDFRIWPSVSIPTQTCEMTGSVTAEKNPVDPNSPDFLEDGLIGNAFWFHGAAQPNSQSDGSIVNDLFMITQDLHLMVNDSEGNPINWQCRFESVKMTGPEEAATNYKQFTISDA
jgi:hypothetical protein